MPDDQDYAALGELLAHPERWSEADAQRARTLLEHQAACAEEYDQRDKGRVASMWAVVRDLDEALATWEATR
jgi:hypothetical protein